MLLKALSGILLILAVAAFCMTVAANFRDVHYHDVAISQMAAENVTPSAPAAGRQPQSEEQRAAKLEADAVSKGEVWFLFNNTAWIVIGCALLVPGIALTAVMRLRRSKKASAAAVATTAGEADKQSTAP